MLAKTSRLNDLTRCSNWKDALVRWGLVLGALLFCTALATPAEAKGRVVWKSTTVQENLKREAWRLELEIHLGKAPDVAYVPMKFEFQPTAHFERALVDGNDKPVERTIPLSNQQSLIESVEVGFLDAGTGVIQSRTKFSFKVTRAHDYVAGEYKVTIRDGRDGSLIGSATTLKFQGENPIIDRRSIVFAGGEKKKKKEEPTEEAQSESASDEPAAEEDSEPEAPTEGDAPPPVEERPGGGCHHSPADSAPVGWLWLSLFAVLALVFRRSIHQR